MSCSMQGTNTSLYIATVLVAPFILLKFFQKQCIKSRKGGQRRNYSVTNSASEEVGSNVSCTVGTERVFST